ncbi:MAG TPA: response regulator, partial [Arenibaculum sp.]|nr:response regulator [Arenibaculum sp.]
PLSRALVTGEPTPGEEYLYRRGDGTWAWVRLIAAPVKGEAGETIATMVAIVDIDREKRIERALRESEKIFRDLTEALPQIVWTATVGGSIEYCNRRWSDFTGTSSDEANGEGWIRYLHPDDASGTLERWHRCVETGEPFETEYRLRCKEGDHHWFLARAMPLRDETGRILRWFGTCTDIGEIVAARQTLALSSEHLAREVADRTRQLEEANARLRTEMEERGRAEEALRHAQKMEAIGQLTGGVAHDFNNLLQVIAGNLQLLAGDLAGNAVAAWRIRSALSGVERGAKLASQLLAFARRQPLAPQVVNLGRLVRSMRDLLRRSLGEEIEIETAVAEGLWNTLIDPVQVENAILNLAVNARDAMAGGGRLTIEVDNVRLDAWQAARHPEAKTGQYVMLAVSDTGTGMPHDVAARAFEPFFTTKPEGHGTGLGLPMVYGFVRQSDGHVELDSEPGRGTTVRIYLPREHREEKRAAAERPAGAVSGGSETILVVEDDPEVRATVVDILRDLGYRVLQAEDGASALEIVRSGVPVDLLFTDVIMPGAVSSPDLAREARRVLPGLAVLFTSGYAQDAIVHGGRLDDGVHLLSKPFRNEELAHRLRQLLDAGSGGDIPASETEREADERSGRRPRVLLVEDELLIRDWTAEMLRDLGHEVEEADSAEEALARLERGGIGVLVTDIGLPGRSGVDLAADAARLDPSIRVVLATGRGRTDVDAGRLGCAAVEFLGKPYQATDIERAMANVLDGQGS